MKLLKKGFTYSILDRITFDKEKDFESYYKETSFKKDRKINHNIKTLQIIFLGWDIKLRNFRKLKVVKENYIVYEIQKGFVNKDPYVVKNIFKELIEDVTNEIESLDEEIKLEIISLSASNGYGFYIANKYYKRVKKFYSVVSGSKLGIEIWNSPLLKKVKNDCIDNNFKSHEEYDKVLGTLLPYYHTKTLPKKTILYLGLFDSYIPVNFGIKIYKKSKETNPNLKLRILPFGHIAVIFIFFSILKTKNFFNFYRNKF